MSPVEATSGSALKGVAKLKTAERYSAWAFYMKTYLQGEGLWKICVGMEPSPTLPDEQAVASTSDAAATTTTGTQLAPKPPPKPSPEILEAIEVWQQKDAKARTRIITVLDESLFPRFSTYNTAQALWSAIQQSYEAASSQNILLWWTELTQTRLEEGGTIQAHADKILEASRKLGNSKFRCYVTPYDSHC